MTAAVRPATWPGRAGTSRGVQVSRLILEPAKRADSQSGGKCWRRISLEVQRFGKGLGMTYITYTRKKPTTAI